jgi:hypothetical protein
MPVPKLSRQFYDTFGDEVANQLIAWFNEVDTTYRTELWKLNDANFARFESTLDQRLAEVEARLRTELHHEVHGLRSEFHKEMGALRGDLVRWTFMFWAASTATTAGLMFAMLQLLVR